MAKQPPRRKEPAPPEKRFSETINRKVERRRQVPPRKEKRTGWFWLGMFGLVGWSIAVPTLVGIALGTWLDTRWPSDVSWTLNLLIIGLILGCLNAWFWVKRETQRD